MKSKLKRLQLRTEIEKKYQSLKEETKDSKESNNKNKGIIKNR